MYGQDDNYSELLAGLRRLEKIQAPDDFNQRVLKRIKQYKTADENRNTESAIFIWRKYAVASILITLLVVTAAYLFLKWDSQTKSSLTAANKSENQSLEENARQSVEPKEPDSINNKGKDLAGLSGNEDVALQEKPISQEKPIERSETKSSLPSNDHSAKISKNSGQRYGRRNSKAPNRLPANNSNDEITGLESEDKAAESAKAPLYPSGIGEVIYPKDVLSFLGAETNCLQEGCKVVSIKKGSRAEALGLRTNDLIIGFDENPINNKTVFQVGVKMRYLRLKRENNLISLDLGNK
ncbi:MAG TPA: hypothetical protein VNK26_05435 [Pyrinomonadaceae bacterium]|nr:hypothetical protein [Pyrinomonadaceae bacterium]